MVLANVISGYNREKLFIILVLGDPVAIIFLLFSGNGRELNEQAMFLYVRTGERAVDGQGD